MRPPSWFPAVGCQARASCPGRVCGPGRQMLTHRGVDAEPGGDRGNRSGTPSTETPGIESAHLGDHVRETVNISHEANHAASSFRNTWVQEGFDRILVDAPCSGLGVLRRHPEAKWQKTSQQLDRHEERQSGILEQVSPYLRPGGVLVYSACSTEPEETTQVVSRFCQDHPEFCHESSAGWLPPHAHSLTNPDGDFLTSGFRYNMDGFFAARLRRT